MSYDYKYLTQLVGVPYEKESERKMLREIKKKLETFKKIDEYFLVQKIGSGIQGRTYVVLDKQLRDFAMKVFRNSKSATTLEKEYEYQKRAYNIGVAPKIYECDMRNKYLLMKLMDSHLFEKGKVIFKKQQQQILNIYKKLDREGIFYNDPNTENFMVKGGDVFLIDYGLVSEINDKLVKSLGAKDKNLNIVYGVIGLVIRLKELNFDPKNYDVLWNSISEENRNTFFST